MFIMANERDFTEWLIREAEKAGSNRRLAAKARIAHTSVSEVIAGTRLPTFNFCAAIASATGTPPIKVFRMAGLLPGKVGPDSEKDELAAIYDLLPPDMQRLLRIQARALLREQRAEEEERRRRTADAAAADAATL